MNTKTKKEEAPHVHFDDDHQKEGSECYGKAQKCTNKSENDENVRPSRSEGKNQEKRTHHQEGMSLNRSSSIACGP